MPHAGYLIARDAVGTLFDHFLKGSLGYQRIVKLAAEGGGIPPQGREGDVSPGLRTFRIADSGLGDTDGFGELARGHAQRVSDCAQPATGRSGQRQRSPGCKRLIKLPNG